MPADKKDNKDEEEQKPVGYGITLLLCISVSFFYLICHRPSPPWELRLESQQDHPRFVIDVVPPLYLTVSPLGCMSYGTPEWQDWVLGEEEGIKHIEFA